MSNWKFDEYGCWNIEGEDFYIFLQPHPSYCDRGRWLAQLHFSGNFAQKIDCCDGWPRYYFDLERAKAEIEAWLSIRGQIAGTLEVERVENGEFAEAAKQALKYCALSINKVQTLLKSSARSFDCAIAARETASNWSQTMTRFYSTAIEDIESLALIIGSPLTQQMLDLALGGAGLKNLDRLTAIKLLAAAAGLDWDELEARHEDDV